MSRTMGREGPGNTRVGHFGWEFSVGKNSTGYRDMFLWVPFDIRDPTLDIRVPTFDIRHPTSDIRHPTFDRMAVMCSAWYQGNNADYSGFI